MASKFTKDHLSEFGLVFFRYFFAARMDYHALFLRIIFWSVPLDFLGLENAFPRTRSQERVPLKTERLFFSVPFAFPLRSLCVP